MNELQIISLVSLLLYFAVLLFAVIRDKKNLSLLDYFFGGRRLPFWALSITFVASWWGAGSAISTADLAFQDGLGAFWYYGVPVLLSTLLMIICSHCIRRVGYLTQGEMMTARYSPGTAWILSVMILLFMTLNAASQMVGIGQIFGRYLGLGYETGVLLGTLIVLVYSMFGGFRGVVLTDIIQFVLLVISAVLVFGVALHACGGFGAIGERAQELGKTDYMSLTSGASKYMSYVITFGFSWMIQANVWQRISATKNDRDAQRMTVMSFFAYIPLYLIVVFTGMAGLVLYETLPDGGVVPALVMDHMSPVLGALVFVGLSAAIMSTMDSLINTGAMTLAMDLYRGRGDEAARLRVSRLATVLVTAVALLVALRIRSILEIAWLASDVITTGVFVPLVAGFFWRRGNGCGAMGAMVVGLCYCLYNLLISFGVSLPCCWEPGSPLQVVLGVIMSSVVYVLGSLLSRPDYAKADAFIARSRRHS